MKDFESEIPCYIHARRLIDALKAASLPENGPRALVICYKILQKIGVVSDAEVKLAQHWAEALRKDNNL